MVRPNSVVHIGHREVHALRNTGNELLRVLVSTPLLVRSERALGLPAQPIVPPNALHENRPTPGVPKPVAGADVAAPTEDGRRGSRDHLVIVGLLEQAQPPL